MHTDASNMPTNCFILMAIIPDAIEARSQHAEREISALLTVENADEVGFVATADGNPFRIEPPLTIGSTAGTAPKDSRAFGKSALAGTPVGYRLSKLVRPCRAFTFCASVSFEGRPMRCPRFCARRT